MGSLKLPISGIVYADAQVFIYSVEKHPEYSALLRPLWQALQAGKIEVVTSELTLMEVLVLPLKQGNTSLVADYERFFELSGLRLLPIDRPVLREAARLRASHPPLHTPDALHIASAILSGSSVLLTNDKDFRTFSPVSVGFLSSHL